MNQEVITKSTIQTDQHQMVLDLNYLIHHESPMWDYHIQHILTAEKYALLINRRLGSPLNDEQLSLSALSHDILKERSLDVTREMEYDGHKVPQDTHRYVRDNLDLLAEYTLDDYFNTSMGFHALAAGIFLHKELNITDHQVLYPIFFHSCPIMDVYGQLEYETQLACDIMMLADKLSSDYLRINMLGTKVRVDLDQIVFGASGTEFNFSLGLLIARTISQGKSQEPNGVEAINFYIERAQLTCPFIPKQYSIKKLGGAKIWPKRESQALKML